MEVIYLDIQESFASYAGSCYFFGKSMAPNTLPSYDLDICSKFRSFFFFNYFLTHFQSGRVESYNIFANYIYIYMTENFVFCLCVQIIPVLTQDNISDRKSVVVWLSREKLKTKKFHVMNRNLWKPKIEIET